jgi:Fe-S-cluster-containing dehydrogenase component
MSQRPDDPDRDEEVWEERARAVLSGSESDPELGIRAARDAQRVAAGDLTEEEFQPRYHDAYLREFGRDERPRLSDGLRRPQPRGSEDRAGDGEDSESPDTESPTVVSRRAMLGTLSGAAVGMLFLGELLRRGVYPPDSTAGSGAAGLGAAGAAGDGAAASARFGMVIDLERCDGCLVCVQACREDNGLADGVLWPYVFTYQEPGEADPRFLVRLCQHCSRAPCVMVCPTAARHRRPSDGLILTDYDTCIGCRYCQVACPYGVNYFQWGDPQTYGGSFDGERRDARGRSVVGDPPKGVMGKCTFCPQRQDQPETRGTAACALACPMNVLHIGDLNDPESPPQRYLAQRREENGGQLHTFRLLEDMGTDPNIIYIGQPPSSRAELAEGPVRYEDWDLVEDRKPVLEPPATWFGHITRRVRA